jgi:hypothetical protein
MHRKLITLAIAVPLCSYFALPRSSKLGAGYRALLFTAAAFAAISALLTWALVRPEETAAVERKSRARQSETFIPME